MRAAILAIVIERHPASGTCQSLKDPADDLCTVEGDCPTGATVAKADTHMALALGMLWPPVPTLTVKARTVHRRAHPPGCRWAVCLLSQLAHRPRPRLGSLGSSPRSSSFRRLSG